MFEAIKARLVGDWRDASRWWSVRWNALGVIMLPLMQAVPTMPPEIQEMLPLSVRMIISGLWCAVAIYFRVYAQKLPSDGGSA